MEALEDPASTLSSSLFGLAFFAHQSMNYLYSFWAILNQMTYPTTFKALNLINCSIEKNQSCPP